MKKASELPLHITVAKAAKLLNTTRPTVNAMAMRGQLRAEEIADRWLILVSSLPADARKKLAALPSSKES